MICIVTCYVTGINRSFQVFKFSSFHNTENGVCNTKFESIERALGGEQNGTSFVEAPNIMAMQGYLSMFLIGIDGLYVSFCCDIKAKYSTNTEHSHPHICHSRSWRHFCPRSLSCVTWLVFRILGTTVGN